MNVKRLLVFIALLGIAGAATIFTVNAVQANTLEEQYELANEAFKAEEFEESVELYLEVLGMDASHQEARRKLAQSYIHLDRIEEAVQTLNEGIYAAPEAGALYTLLSDVYSKEGDIEKAYRTLKKGLRYSEDPSVQETYDHLLSKITIDGERKFVQEGYEREYRLVWSDGNGNLYPLEAEWMVEEPTIGEVTPVEEGPTVTFKGIETGQTEVVVTWEDFTQTMKVTVEEQVLEEVTFSPEELDAFSLGESITIETTGKDAAGEEMTFEPEWAVTEGKVQLTPDGPSATLTAEESGLDVLTVSYQDFTKELPVMVEGESESESFVQTNVEGQGRIAVTPDQESYETGDVVQLQAIGEQGWTFVRWTVDIEGTQSTIEHTIDGHLNVTAIFESNSHALNLTIEGEGEVFRDSLTNTYSHGETISLRARPASGWSFAGWEGDLTSSTTTARLTFDEDKQVRAVFVEEEQDEDEEVQEEEEEEQEEVKETTKYRLNVGKSGKGTIKQSRSGSSFEDGTLVTLTATPSNGYEFVGWRGDVNHSSRTVTIKMNSHYSLKAVFQEVTQEPDPEPEPDPQPEPEPEPELYTLTTSTDGQGYIRVSKQRVPAGQRISVQAIPAEGWTFVRWEGETSGGSASTSIKMNRNKHVTAVFKQVNESDAEEE